MSNRPKTTLWLTLPRPNPRARMRLFCFPYAGGSASIYRGWPESLPPAVELLAVQPPGRGTRLMEPAFTRLPPLVEAVKQAVRGELDRPFAFFGHSMGAVLAFELARALQREGGPRPVGLFVSGRRAPQLPPEDGATYRLPEAEFMEELRRLKGTPREVLEHPELMSLILPLLRADFEAVETYEYRPGPPLDCHISAYGGAEDSTDRRQLEAWREQTTGSFSARVFPGDHFFLHSCQAHLLRELSEKLNQLGAAAADDDNALRLADNLT